MKRKRRRRQKKRKHRNHDKACVMQQKANLDAYVDLWINLFVEMSSDQIIEGLLTSDDGKYSMWVYIPGVPGEIEIEFHLEDFLRECNGDAKEAFKCKIHQICSFQKEKQGCR